MASAALQFGAHSVAQGNCYGMDGSILLWVFAILRSCDKL